MYTRALVEVARGRLALMCVCVFTCVYVCMYTRALVEVARGRLVLMCVCVFTCV